MPPPQQLPNILLARLTDGDEQVGVIEHAIQTYYASDPETGVSSLIQALNANDGNIAVQQGGGTNGGPPGENSSTAILTQQNDVNNSDNP
jgi:hypothetical protein